MLPKLLRGFIESLVSEQNKQARSESGEKQTNEDPAPKLQLLARMIETTRGLEKGPEQPSDPQPIDTR